MMGREGEWKDREGGYGGKGEGAGKEREWEAEGRECSRPIVRYLWKKLSY